MYVCKVVKPLAGGSSSHNSLISDEVGTTCPECMIRVPSTVRSLGAEGTIVVSAAPSTSGPRISTVTTIDPPSFFAFNLPCDARSRFMA